LHSSCLYQHPPRQLNSNVRKIGYVINRVEFLKIDIICCEGKIGTLRGDQPSPLQSVTLPAALAKVTIILPRYSESGRYAVAVIRDRTGNDLLAHGSACAIGTGDREEVSIDLDLRNSQPGSYLLSTTHEQDQASYYCPPQIK
jgi:hypothetical protein